MRRMGVRRVWRSRICRRTIRQHLQLLWSLWRAPIPPFKLLTRCKNSLVLQWLGTDSRCKNMVWKWIDKVKSHDAKTVWYNNELIWYKLADMMGKQEVADRLVPRRLNRRWRAQPSSLFWKESSIGTVKTYSHMGVIFPRAPLSEGSKLSAVFILKPAPHCNQ